LPTCLTLNKTTGILSGTVMGGCAGTATPTFTLTDSGTATALTASTPLNLVISPAPAISFSGSVPTSATYNVAFSGSAAASGGVTGSALTYSTVGTWPTWLSLNSSTGAISGTPAAIGSFSFTVQAADAFGDTATQKYTITVGKGTPNVSAWPTASGITFGQTLASSTLTGGVSTPAGSFAFTSPSTAPSAGTASYGVTFTPTDTTDYTTVTGTVSVTVAKATSNVSAWPTASGITYGQTLASSTLTGGASTPAGAFAWTTASTVPGAGTASYGVTFTPTDAADYTTVTGTVSVTVAKAASSVSVWPTASGISYGLTLASSTLTGGVSTPAGSFAWTTGSTVPTLGTASYGVTFTPTDATDYTTVTGTVSLTVGKATPSVSVWPTASGITYGQTLASSTLTGGASIPAGSFAWTTPSTAPGAGTASYNVTFTPSNTTDYNTVTGTVSVTVAKATSSVSAWPTASGITYGQTLASSTLTGGASTPVGSFAWTTASAVPTTGTAVYGVTFTPTDATDYTTVTGTVSLTVGKATPTVSAWPTAGGITYGQTLASSTLTGGTASTAGTFAWVTSTTSPAVGTTTYPAIFTPTDTTDYNTVTGSVSVTTGKATPTVSVWPTASGISYGQTLANSTLSGGTASVSGTFTWTASSTAPTAGTTSYAVTFTPTNATDYNLVAGSVSVTTAKVTPTVSVWPTAGGITYGQTLAGATLTGGAASVGGTFTWAAPGTAPSAGTASFAVVFTPSDTTDYTTVTGTVSVTTATSNVTVTAWPTASGLTYGQTLANSTLSGGTASVGGTFAWTAPSTAPTTGTASYSVTFTPTDTTDYNTATGSVSVTTAKATPTVSVWPTAGGITFGQTLASSTLSGGTGSVGGSFAWTAPSTAPTAGTASFAVTFTPTDATDYNTVTGSVSVTTGKATPTVSAWPTAGGLTYGQTLASSTLSGGTASTPGTFKWTTSTTSPAVGTATYAVTFTPTDTTDFNTVTGSVSVATGKGTPTVSVWPTAGGVTYGQTLASSTLSGGTASVSGTFAWAAPSTAPTAGTASYAVIFTPSDSTDYNTVTGTVSVTTTTSNVTVSAWPTASGLTYGQTLAASTLSGGTASVGGSFAWTAPSMAPTAGTASYSVTFTPTDTTDYNPVVGSVSVTTAKATPTVSAWPTAGGLTYGQTLASSTLTGGAASVGGTFSWTTSTTSPAVGTTTYPAIFTPSDTIDYNTVTGSVSVTTGKATPTVSAWPTAGGLTYGQTLASSTLTGGTASTPGSFAWTTSTVSPTAGTTTYSVTFTPSSTADYTTVTGTVSVTTATATLTVTASSTTVAFGSPVPTITPIYSGFQNGDTAASLTTAPTCTTTYTTSSAVGSTPTTSCAGGVSSNYTFIYVPGTVSVTAIALPSVSGQISLLNNCAGATAVPPMTVKLASTTTGKTYTTTTDNNGNYSIAVATDTYTITPTVSTPSSGTAPSSVFYPATQSVTMSGSSVTGENFSATLGYAVSGYVTYNGAQSGQIYLRLSATNCGSYGAPGTSIAYPFGSGGGAFTINGVSPGAYTLQAWMDNSGSVIASGLPSGTPNVINPTGSTSGLSVTNDLVSSAAVKLIDPTVTAVSNSTPGPTLKLVSPTDQGVAINFSPVTNSSQVEAVTSYQVQWSSSSSFTGTPGSYTFAANGSQGVWILNNGLAGFPAAILSNGSPYYFRARGLLAGNHTAWFTTSSPITPGAPPSSASTSSVSGTVTLPTSNASSGDPITSYGQLYVGFYNQVTGAVYADRIGSPSNPQAYSVNVPNGSDYVFFAILDQNNNGLIDTGDITNLSANGSPVAISSNMSGYNYDFSTAGSTPAGSSLPVVTTQMTNFQDNNTTSYGMNLQVYEGIKLPVAAELTGSSYSGASGYVLAPVDLSACTSCGKVQLDYQTGIGSAAPTVNDTLALVVTYSDGTMEPAFPLVTGAGATYSDPNSGATTTVAAANLTLLNSNPNQPGFLWSDPTNAENFTYSFWLSDSKGSTIWQIPAANSKVNGFDGSITQITWGTDPTGNTSNNPTVTSLTSGAVYTWSIQVVDSNGNSSTTQASFKP
jgi:hypothetical protein